MAEEKKVEYRRANWFELIFGMANNGNGICFYLLMMYASYIATEGYGIAVATMGIIATATRLFDAVSDTFVGWLFDVVNPKKGKLRIFLVIGFIIESLAAFAMFNWAVGKHSGVQGIVFFVIIYIIYFIGYTINGIAGGAVGTVLTNDPKQRGMVGLIGTMYSYITPMVFNTIISFLILPKYDNQYNAPMLKEACFLYAFVGGIFVLVACIALWRKDTIEIFESSKPKKNPDEAEQKLNLKEMWRILKGNKPLQMMIVATASDKIATTTASQSLVNTLLAGILIGSYKASTMVGNVSMVIGIVFAFVGGAMIGKTGTKKTTLLWTWVSLIANAIMIGACFIMFSTGTMTGIGIALIPTVVYCGLMIIKQGAQMAVTTANTAMIADVTDYELTRSGHYIPGIVANIKSLLDKVISAFGNAIAAFMIAFIGYKTTTPQMGDPATWPLFWMSMFLSFGLPIIGFACTIVSMKWYHLTKEEMVNVANEVHEMRENAKAEA